MIFFQSVSQPNGSTTEQLVLVLRKCLCLLAFIFLHVTLNIRMVYRLVSKQRDEDGNFLIGKMNLVILLREKMLRRGAVMDGVVPDGGNGFQRVGK